MPEKMTEFEKGRWEKSINKSPQECDWHLQGDCYKDLSDAGIRYCNNGHPCIKKQKCETWEGCKYFEDD